MAMKRLDIRVKKDGSVDLNPVVGSMSIEKDKYGNTRVLTGSWKIRFRNDSMELYCSSKAKQKRRNFRVSIRSGSLFLYNTTYNWYWNFRSAKVQKMLDEFKIDRMINVDTTIVSISTVFKMEDGKRKEYQDEKYQTIKYFSDDLGDYKVIKQGETNNVIACDVIFHFKKFLIIETKENHRLIYMNNCKLSDIYEYLKENMKIYSLEE